MSVTISWANKMQLAKCDIMVSFCKSSHILLSMIVLNNVRHDQGFQKLLSVLCNFAREDFAQRLCQSYNIICLLLLLFKQVDN